MNEVIWTLNTKSDSLHNLAGYLRSEIKQYLADHQLRQELLIDDTVYVPLPVSAIWHRHVALVVKEVLHNIVKHAFAQQVTVSMQLVRGVFLLDIRDDGQGFDTTGITRGNGLRNMKKRIGHLKGTLVITSEPGKGARVCISIPVNNPDEN